MSDFVLSTSKPKTVELALDYHDRGGSRFAKKSATIPIVQAKKGRIVVREVRDVSIELLIGNDLLGDPVGAHRGERCSAIAACSFHVIAGNHPHSSNGFTLELLANGAPWKVIHTGRIPGASIPIGGHRTLTFKDGDPPPNVLDLDVFDFVHASHLRVTMHADAYYK